MQVLFPFLSLQLCINVERVDFGLLSMNCGQAILVVGQFAVDQLKGNLSTVAFSNL